MAWHRSARCRGPARVLSSALTAAALVALAAISASPGPVRAGGVSVDLDQWASLDAAWQNGDLNGNNSRYPEGGVIPFRLAIEGLAAGAHSITINYDFTASGHKAYDFLATWNATSHPGLCLPSGGAISSMCPKLPSPSSFTFPSDPYVANGLAVRGAETWSGVSRRLTIYGGTISSITGPTHSGSPDGNSSAGFVVRFRSTSSAVLLAWGGHLAQSSYWDKAGGGGRDGASMVSGAPWHMRTLGLDGGGNRNQDRSIQPSAVVGEMPPAVAAPTPPSGATPRPGGGNPGAPGGGPHPTVPPTETGAPEPAGSPAGGGFALGIAVAVLAAVATAGRTRHGAGSRRRRTS